jgi:hypothetical protein
LEGQSGARDIHGARSAPSKQLLTKSAPIGTRDAPFRRFLRKISGPLVYVVHHSSVIPPTNGADWCTWCTILKVRAAETRYIGASGAPFFRHFARKQFRLVHAVHHFEGLCHGNAAHWCFWCTILSPFSNQFI